MALARQRRRGANSHCRQSCLLAPGPVLNSGVLKRLRRSGEAWAKRFLEPEKSVDGPLSVRLQDVGRLFDVAWPVARDAAGGLARQRLPFQGLTNLCIDVVPFS